MLSRSAILRNAAGNTALRGSIYLSRYIQGPGALNVLGTELKRLGGRALVIQDPFVAKTMTPQIEASLNTNVDATLEQFGAECCDDEIKRIAGLGDFDVIAGVGGGKTIDTAKAVAHTLRKPVAIVPTLAASDAPCTALSVIYTKTGEFDRYLVLPQNPNLVLVDSEIISKAPVRTLVAGMGDAMATWFEAESCFKTQAINLAGYLSSFTSIGIARMCWQTLLEFGEQAKVACEAHAPCPALERVIEANVLLSGSGAESGGMAAAHAIHNGLTVLEETHGFLHGEKVAFGVCVSMFLTDKPADIVDTVYSFCESVGLPTTFADIGVKEVSPEKLLKVAQLSLAPEETIHHEAGVITPEALVSAMRAADAFGAKRKAVLS